MKHEHFWAMCAAASTALVAIVGASGAAVAQKQLPPVTVTGPRPSQDGMSVRVSYRDLNLAAVSGERTLSRRVDKATHFVCDPSRSYGGGDFAYNDCLSYAWTGARPQIAQAVRRAHDIAMTGTSSIPMVAIAIAAR